MREELTVALQSARHIIAAWRARSKSVPDKNERVRQARILSAWDRDLQWTIAYLTTGDDRIFGRFRRCIPMDPSQLSEWLDEGMAYPLTQSAEPARLAVLSALDDLSPREREAYVMKIGEGMSYGAIGELLGIDRLTVRDYVERARAKIKRLAPHPAETLGR